ncbi:uncharacterized protein LOC129456530 [Periophthalmus magnuspinnatus]|uniref:uncharacterized protein LOC129456530 n=1 Tax=Periophthalmus magnuspinnatus TaxID=409849 RepID=UPI00243735C3|nr:uncharacterized protein LOC129456530 [Periophthalmus magnuspinnatus]
MDSYQRESTRRLRRNSRTLQDIIHKGIHEAARDTPIPAKAGRDPRMIHSVASLIRAKSKLLLLESPDTVEIYKLDDPPLRSRPLKDGVYLPAIAAKASSLTSLRGLGLGPLSQSCPYLYDKRRGSFSSVASQRTGQTNGKQNTLKTRREAKKSNVTVSMTYLGQGRRRTSTEVVQDELKVLQQVNGGENLCVFKGMVTPGEQFQFISQRHRGYPFSATFYVNGLMVARISSCCEYRYTPGFQQGKKSSFRLAWLAGGVPCYRCTSLRNKYSSCQQLSNGTKENFILPPEQGLGHGTKAGNEGLIFPVLPKPHSSAVSADVESCPSSPLFLPAKPEKKAARRTRKQHKNNNENASTDNDEQTATGSSKASEKKRRRKAQSRRKRSKDKDDTKTATDKREEKRRGSEEEVSNEEERTSVETKQNKEPKEKTPSFIQPTHTAQPAPTQQTTEHRPPTETVQTAPPHRPSAPLQQKQQTRRNTTRGTHDSPQVEKALTQQKVNEQEEHGSNEKTRAAERQRDFYKECVEMSAALERGPSKHNWFKANILERCRLQKKLSSGPKSPGSDVELSAESESVQPEEEPEEEEEEEEEEPVPEQDLEAQVEAMITVLRTCDAVEQLVLRNTALTDDLLLSLAGALKISPSLVTLLNLNLNLIGPYGAHILLEVMRVKPHIKALHLFGNRFRDHGLQTLLTGVVELQEQSAMAAAAVQQALLLPPEHEAFVQQAMAALPCDYSSFRVFALVELDVGGNGLGSEGVKLLASYMRHHSYLRYLGLAQTSGADLAAWKELFESLKENMFLTQIILDENNLGDPGVRLLAEVLAVNVNLQKVDLDGNGISDVGGNDIMGALLSRTQLPLRHLSLNDNNISAGLVSRIQEQVDET